MSKAYTLCLNWDIKVIQHTQTNECDTLAKHNVENRYLQQFLKSFLKQT